MHNEHPDLALVMPVYNESQCVGQVIEDWQRVLRSLSIHYRMIILNDGSTDGTSGVLDKFSKHPDIHVIHKENQGHGPTVLRGYRMAVKQADWVFQCDSDNEMPAEAFGEFWRRRKKADAVFAVRVHRRQSMTRSLVSAMSRFCVKILAGGRVQDVNVPYRLMRCNVLAGFLDRIPADSFTPNVNISAAFSHSRMRVLNLPVSHRNRQTGMVMDAFTGWKMLKSSLLSLRQLLSWRFNNSPSTGDAEHE